jgi:dethiobiotin synthetase
MSRVVVLGCGTGVGKTRVSASLLRELERRGLPSLGLKPIESGVAGHVESGAPAAGSDAGCLAQAGSLRTTQPHPLHAFADPVSPHLAARAQSLQIDVKRVTNWVVEAEREAALQVSSDRAIWTVLETAGGVYSPLAPGLSNFDLAVALEPAIWVLVAADALGVLHQVSATLQAMRACARVPDHVVLSGAHEPDASTGSNAAELCALGIATVSAVLARNDDRGIRQLVDRLLEGQ